MSNRRRTGCIRFESEFGAGGPDEPRFERPLFVLDRKGHVIEDNMSEFLAWRKRTAPEAYKSAMDGLVELLAEIAVRDLMLETEIGQPGFSFFWACRERMREIRPVEPRAHERIDVRSQETSGESHERH